MVAIRTLGSRMRIHTLEVQNFKKFVLQELELHPRFTLLVGDNGSGKTSVLDALAVSLGIWLVHPPDTLLRSSGRNILRKEIRLEPSPVGDRLQFREQLPVRVLARGQIGLEAAVSWTRQLGESGDRVHELTVSR